MRPLSRAQIVSLQFIRDQHGIGVGLAQARALERRGLVRIVRTDRAGENTRGYWRAELTPAGLLEAQLRAPGRAGDEWPGESVTAGPWKDGK